MKSFALLFPGQGAQYVSMGQSFVEDKDCEELFDMADSALGLPLRELMLLGPMDKLTETAVAQPAILLHSILAFRALEKIPGISFTCALGHSLGEYSALVAANVISLADALKAVHTRGTLMQEAVPIGMGGMSAVLGMDAREIIVALNEFADDKSPIYAVCANFNGPLQTVIAGTKLGIIEASKKLKSLGAKRIIDLPVSAPFHCALMRPAQQKMTEVLSSIHFNDARFPIISNVSARAETQGFRLRELLLLQMASAVRFTDCVATVMKHGFMGEGYVELGPKNTLSSIVKKIDPSSATQNIDSMTDLKDFMKGISS